MTKIIQQNNNSKPLPLENVLNVLKTDSNALVCLVSNIYNVTFSQVGNKFVCVEHGGVKIEPVKKEPNIYTVSNYSNALGIPKGQIKNQLFEITKHLTGFERVKKQLDILVSLGLAQSDYSTSPQITQTSPKIQQISNELAKQALDSTEPKEPLKTPNFTTYKTPYGKKVSNQIQTKTGATVQTLEKYNVSAAKSMNEIRYCYLVGACIKSKYPNRDRKNGKYGLYPRNADTSNYLFGLEQLPSAGEFLILASGEDDVLCINHNLNQYGIFAVCAWNEICQPPKHLLNSLKTRFKQCFVLGDNDNVPTTKRSLEIAILLDFVWIDTTNARTFFNLAPKSDICDIFQVGKLKEFVFFCLGCNSLIESYKDDTDSIRIDHCYKIDFAQYLGQTEPNQYGVTPIDFVLHQISQHDRLILESLAGTGKSTLLTLITHQGVTNARNLTTPNIEYLRGLGIDRVIILEPTTAINTQLPQAFKELGLQVAAIDNLSDTNDLKTALESPVMMVCYDSLAKVQHLLSNALVIVDEYHQLPIDINYRNPKAFRLVLQGIKTAKKVVLLSATPNYLFTLPKEVCNDFGYKLIKGVSSVQNKIVISPIIYNGKRKDLPLWVIENSPKDEGLITIKYDSKDNLAATNESLNNRGIACDFFHSGNPSRKENNVNYNSIMKTGYLSQKLRVLLYTTLMEAGVSIKENVVLNALLDVESWQKGIQLISRPRYNVSTGANKVINVQIFRSLKSTKKEFIQPKTSIVERFKKELDKAQNECDILNGNTFDGDKSPKTKANDKKLEDVCFFNQDTNLYEPCVLWILRLLYEQEKNVPFEVLLKRMQRFDNRITINDIKDIEINVYPDLEEIRAVQKLSKEDANNRLLDLTKSNPLDVAQTVCYLHKNTDFKEMVKDVLKLPQVPKATVSDFLTAADGAFTGNEPNRIIKDICFFVEQGKCIESAVNTVVSTEKKEIEDLKSQTARKERHNGVFNGTISAVAQLQYGRERAIVKRLDIIKRDGKAGKRSEWLTSKDVTTTINKAIKGLDSEYKEFLTLVSQSKAMVILNDLYEVERMQKREGKKRVWVYKIGEKKTRFDGKK